MSESINKEEIFCISVEVLNVNRTLTQPGLRLYITYLGNVKMKLTYTAAAIAAAATQVLGARMYLTTTYSISSPPLTELPGYSYILHAEHPDFHQDRGVPPRQASSESLESLGF